MKESINTMIDSYKIKRDEIKKQVLKSKFRSLERAELLQELADYTQFILSLKTLSTVATNEEDNWKCTFRGKSLKRQEFRITTPSYNRSEKIEERLKETIDTFNIKMDDVINIVETIDTKTFITTVVIYYKG